LASDWSFPAVMIQQSASLTLLLLLMMMTMALSVLCDFVEPGCDATQIDQKDLR
jgi:hypothetical protein